MDYLNQWVSSKRKVLLSCVVISFFLHSPFMNLPPQSIHVWRQCSTLTVARNFYEEGMNPLQPRIDQRFDTNGVTGMQFPAYEFLVALDYQLVGFHHFVHRYVSFAIFMLGAWGIYELFLLLFSNRWAAALGAWSFCWSPELFFFGISALPDVLALTGSVWGICLFIFWFRKGGFSPYLLSLAATTIGGLSKIQYLVIGFPIAVLVLSEKRKYTWPKIWALLVYALLSVGITLAWYRYAAQLIHASGLTDYDLGFAPPPDFVWAARVAWHNAVSEIPELILNYATFTYFALGVYVCFKDRRWKSPWFLPLLVWAVAVLAYYLIEIRKMSAHSYYLLPFLPLLLVFAVLGGLFLKESRYRWLFVLLLMAQPIVAFFRIVPHRFWSPDKAVPRELYNEESRKRLEGAAPNDKLCIVGADDSRTVYFYYLHKKGFGFNRATDLIVSADGVPLIEQYVRRGAEYLYTDDLSAAQARRLQPYLRSVVLEEGAFKVFKLGLPGAKDGLSTDYPKTQISQEPTQH